jgi:hypothetical protein
MLTLAFLYQCSKTIGFTSNILSVLVDFWLWLKLIKATTRFGLVKLIDHTVFFLIGVQTWIGTLLKQNAQAQTKTHCLRLGIRPQSQAFKGHQLTRSCCKVRQAKIGVLLRMNCHF